MNNQENQAVGAAGRVIVAILLGFLVLVAGGVVITLFKITPESSLSKPWLGPFCMHTTMLVVSTLLILILTKGRISSYGFRWVSIRPLRLVIPLSFAIGTVAALVQASVSSEEIGFLENFTFGNFVLFVWIYASICEEVLTRGLIQGYLAPLAKSGFSIFRLRISLPVLVGALFFSLMHIMAFAEIMSIASLLIFLVFAIVLGIIAGYWREKTGSLLPAIVVHMMFNVSGSFVDFLIGLIS